MTRFAPPRPIRPDDVVDGFSCGDAALDDWLLRRAIRNEQDGGSRTYVTIAGGAVAGYHCLSAAALPRPAATGRARRNMPDPIPALLLGRLAVDLRFQGRQVGANLLRDAIRRSLAASEVIGARILLVHAADESARRFYQHFEFEPSATDPMHLMLVLADARAAGFE